MSHLNGSGTIPIMVAIAASAISNELGGSLDLDEKDVFGVNAKALECNA
ncbi:MAG TPA: hypothetical protein VN207_02810 [Ktedonobacteraceae bacterium]|nr:hypothetical protein [Ktedonobacteraceae bacterium]